MNQKTPDEPLDEARAIEPVFVSYEQTSSRRGGPMIPRQRQLLIVVSVLAAFVIVIAAVLLWRWRNAAPAEEKTSVVVSVKVS